MVQGFEPRAGLCADSSEPGARFGFRVSLSLCPSPARALSLSLSLSLRKKETLKKKHETSLNLEGVPGLLQAAEGALGIRGHLSSVPCSPAL